jgi:hypothetical protein
MFKAASIIMAKGADPARHRATVKGDEFEYTMVASPLFDFARATQVAKELAQQGIQSLVLCPGFTHEAAAMIRQAVGEGVAINTARGDVPSTMMTAQILTKEGWLPAGH